MAEEQRRLSHYQAMQQSLVAVGYPDTLDADLDFAGGVLDRAVEQLKQYERSVNYQSVSERDRLKAVFVLNTMYALEKKFHQPQ